ncbi:hypothetical protein CYMTET_50298 [Cymbomonas tetramitiformis]|uniref:Uncharacterized protein n=1 Tax=Cymbomonas tetramitiformis TaxID=36881 RepID=A0AAE0EUW5_9CHLO|nr:hypothetical protein CYMTET_50298 [Cymbomonas tetramitiformis]
MDRFAEDTGCAAESCDLIIDDVIEKLLPDSEEHLEDNLTPALQGEEDEDVAIHCFLESLEIRKMQAKADETDAQRRPSSRYAFGEGASVVHTAMILQVALQRHLLLEEAKTWKAKAQTSSSEIRYLEGALEQARVQQQHWRGEAESLREAKQEALAQAEELWERTQRELTLTDAELKDAREEHQALIDDLARENVARKRLEEELDVLAHESNLQAKLLKEQLEVNTHLKAKVQVYREECKLVYARLAEQEDRALETCDATKRLESVEQELQIVSNLLYTERGAK